MIISDLRGLLTIKIKPRDDNMIDQYSRIFMVKIFLVSSVVCGLNWYFDKFNCILPEKMLVSKEFKSFAASSCWIQGVYIYKELVGRNDDMAYYGISKDIDEDGTYADGQLCKTITNPGYNRNEQCEPMEKTFYIQYQYMSLLLGVSALIYYLPYLYHKNINHDMVRLNREIEKKKPRVQTIYKHYFKNHKRNTVIMYRQPSILVVKVLYVVVNVGTFLVFDNIFNGLFVGFGSKWFKWVSLDNTDQFDYMGGSKHPKPANALLPPFGYCEISSSAKDIKESHNNMHKVICELSQHVLYQYTLVLLWLLIVIGIIVSLIGLIVAIIRMISASLRIKKLGQHPETKNIYHRLTTRQIDYLEFLKEKNIEIYGEILALFTDDISRDQSSSP